MDFLIFRNCFLNLFLVLIIYSNKYFYRNQWCSGEPNNWSGTMNSMGEGCLQFLDLCLNDMFCDVKIAYICKKSLFNVHFYYK